MRKVTPPCRQEGEVFVKVMQYWSKQRDIHAELSSSKGVGLTVGNFDGVHLGHQKLIHELIQTCESSNLQSVVVTFDPHPKKVIQPEELSFDRLFSLEDLKEQMIQYRVDHLWVQNFNLTLSQMEPVDFLKEYLTPLPIRYVIVGHDFRFGKGRKGKISDLQSWCEQKKIKFKIFSPFEFNGVRVSTSHIRKFLLEAQLDKVRQFLGRPFSVCGPVQKGLQRGKELRVSYS